MPPKQKIMFSAPDESFASDGAQTSLDRYLDDSQRPQGDDDDGLPRTVPLANIDTAILSDDEYTALFVNVVRAIIQPSPWRSISDEDRISMLRRARDVFLTSSEALDGKLLKRLVRRVSRENSISCLRNQYLSFMQGAGRIPWTEDKHRERSNWVSDEAFAHFRDSCFEKIEQRLRMINQSASKDFAEKNKTWKTWLEISTGKAMQKPPDIDDATKVSFRTEYFSNESGTVVNPEARNDIDPEFLQTAANEPTATAQDGDAAQDLFNSAKRTSCFGNALSITFHSAVWRGSSIGTNLNQASAQATAGPSEQQLKEWSKSAKSFPNDLHFSVEVLIGGVPQYHELDVRGRAVGCAVDPDSMEVDYEDIPPELKPKRSKSEIVPDFTVKTPVARPYERYWTLEEPFPKLGVFLGSANVPPSSVTFRIHIKKANFTCFFSFTDLAVITIPASDLYQSILPLGCIGRGRAPTSGFHLVHKHYVDEDTGFGLTLTLELNCLAKTHCEPPLYFNPGDPETGIDKQTGKAIVPQIAVSEVEAEMRMWNDMWSIDHHAGMLQLFDMFGSINDLEYMILEAYSDRYLLDQELFDVAAMSATARFSPFDNADERLDAVNATQALVTSHNATRTYNTREFIETALEDIRAHVVDILTALEIYVPSPLQASGALADAMAMLSACGSGPKEFGDLIQSKVKTDITEAIAAYSSTRKTRTVDQKVKALFSVAHKVFLEVQCSLEYSELASPNRENQRVLALALRRVDVMLSTLVPSLEQFVFEIMRLSSQDNLSDRSEQDPLGETFCILSTLYGKAIECADFIGQYSVLEKLANRLSGVFDAFLTTWLILSEKRTLQWIRLTVAKNDLTRTSPRIYSNQAPCDALHLLNELFEFFGHCGECCPEDVILGSTPLFCKLINKVAEEFSHQLVAKGLSIDVDTRKEGEESIKDVLAVMEQKFVCVSSLKQFRDLMDRFWVQRVFPELIQPLSAEGRQELLGNAMAWRAECRAFLEGQMFTFSETHAVRDFLRENLRRVAFQPWEEFCLQAKDKRLQQRLQSDQNAEQEHVNNRIDMYVMPVYRKMIETTLHNLDPKYVEKDLLKPLLRAMEDSYCHTVIGPSMMANNETVLRFQHMMAARVLEGIENVATTIVAERIANADVSAMIAKCRKVRYLSKQTTSSLTESIEDDIARGIHTRSSGIDGRMGGTHSEWIIAIIKKRGDCGDKEASTFVKQHKL